MSNVNGKQRHCAATGERYSGLRRHSEEANRVAVESLQQALLYLAERKSYEKITVTELCAKAGVSRMAFYGNFGGKDDIIVNIVLNLHNALIMRLGSPFKRAVMADWYAELFLFIRENAATLRSVFNAGFSDKYLPFVNNLILNNDRVSADNKYLYLLWVGGIVNAAMHWISCDCLPEPQVMAQYCNRCFADFLPSIN